jgi:hypothetical protein
MSSAITWSVARTGLYLVFIVAGIFGGALILDSAHGRSGLSDFGSGLGHPATWLPQVAGTAAMLGLYMLLVLMALSAGRRKLSSATLKMILLPFLLLPVALIDLAGTTVPFTLGFLAVQVLYLIAVRMKPRSRLWPC